MCLAQWPQRSDAQEARTRGPSVSSQALYHWANALPILFLKTYIFTITNSEDPDEMQHMLHFIWVFTVCKNTRLGVSRLQRVKKRYFVAVRCATITFLFIFLFDSLRPINNLSVLKGLMFLLKDTTQWRRWGLNPRPSVSSQALYHWATALPIPIHDMHKHKALRSSAYAMVRFTKRFPLKISYVPLRSAIS